MSDQLSPKNDLLLSVYRMAFEEMSWRRNASYRTIIIGFGYFGLLIAVIAMNKTMALPVRACIAGVMVMGSAFGAAYLASNYGKYCAAIGRMVAIEDYLGAFAPDFLGAAGALMPADRKQVPHIPLVKNTICVCSVAAFFIGGLVTAAAVLLI